jgi:uncharacterized protein YecE (DUF72 family)
MNKWFLGTIGFSYHDWSGTFYPPGLAQRNYLPYYSKVFNTVELDTTFHSIPRASSVRAWYSSTPDNFRFCLKTPRMITHELALKGAEGLMAEFLDAIHPLNQKLGAILIQLPPSFTQDFYPQLLNFLKDLPGNFNYAVELRHPSWYNTQTHELLSKYQICWVTIDFPDIPMTIQPTTNYLYIRWIGVNGLYKRHSYERVDKTDQMKWWLQEISPYSGSIQTIYGFFNNDYAGFAAGSCLRFKHLAGQNDVVGPEAYQDRLF